MNFTVSIAELQNLLDNQSPVEVEVRAYNGRAMYGAECLAITLDGGLGDVLAIGQALQQAVNADLVGDDLAAWIEEGLTHNVREDSMGRGQVIYWPSTTTTA